MPHAIVIGAGPAGSVVALLLARAGWHVDLVEQHRFPRDKVCGECLSALGIQVLRRIGLHDAVRDLGARQLVRTNLYSPSGAPLSLKLHHLMWGISRSAFDGTLLDAARSAGAVIHQPARCEKIDGAESVMVRSLTSNTSTCLSADIVVWATGKAPAPGGAFSDFGIKAHFEQVEGPLDAIELFGINGSYGGIAPIERGRWNFAFSVPGRRLCGDIEALFHQLRDENRALAARMRGARRVGEWLAAPLPRFQVARDWPAGVIPVGNSAASLEPVGGEGMGLAMRSAELACDVLINSARTGEACDMDELRCQFNALWRTRSLIARAVVVGLSRPAVANRVFPGLAGLEEYLEPLLRLIGKSS